MYATLIDAVGWCVVDCQANLADQDAWHIPTAHHAHKVPDLLEERTGRVLLDARNADRFAGPERLRRRFAPVVDGATQVVCYCGFDEPTLYAGSWSEWIQDATRPRGP